MAPSGNNAAVANINAPVLLSNGNMMVAGNTAGGMGIINIGPGAIIAGGDSPIGPAINGFGVVNMTGGTVTPGQPLFVRTANAGTVGIWNMTGGLVQLFGNNSGTLGYSPNTTGVLNISGGRYTSIAGGSPGPSGISVGINGVGILNVSGSASMVLGGTANSVGLNVGSARDSVSPISALLAQAAVRLPPTSFSAPA